MVAEIITIGDELLMGLTVDTNSAWMGQFLTARGFKTNRIVTISDKREEIIDAIDTAMLRADLVLVTGGLGPTSDDITKGTLAEYFNSKLVKNEEVFLFIEKLLGMRGLEMNQNNKDQSLVPENCKVLSNRKGTAPGMLFEKNGKVLVSMPGVPYEMKDIMENQIDKYIKYNFNKDTIAFKITMVYGTFEAKLAEILEPFEAQLPSNISLAYLPTDGIIKLRLTASGSDEIIIENQLNKQLEVLAEYIPEYIYGYNGELLEESVGKLLKRQNNTLSLAESCTGGTISRMITSIPGSSEYFLGGLVAYHNDIKTDKLNVPAAIIEKHGAVSKETALAMAEGARLSFNSTYSVSVTGIAGPGGGTEDKPVGTVWIAVSSKDKSKADLFTFGNVREHNMRRASLAALNMLREFILDI